MAFGVLQVNLLIYFLFYLINKNFKVQFSNLSDLDKQKMEFCVAKSESSKCQESPINGKFQSNCKNLSHKGFRYIPVTSLELPKTCDACVTDKPELSKNSWCVLCKFQFIKKN